MNSMKCNQSIGQDLFRSASFSFLFFSFHQRTMRTNYALYTHKWFIEQLLWCYISIRIRAQNERCLLYTLYCTHTFDIRLYSQLRRNYWASENNKNDHIHFDSHYISIFHVAFIWQTRLFVLHFHLQSLDALLILLLSFIQSQLMCFSFAFLIRGFQLLCSAMPIINTSKFNCSALAVHFWWALKPLAHI